VNDPETGKNPEYMLHCWEEAVGTLLKIQNEGGFLRAVIGNIIVILPYDMEDKLRPLIGKRIGVLRTDIPGKEYLIKEDHRKKAQAIDVEDAINLAKPEEQSEKARA